MVPTAADVQSQLDGLLCRSQLVILEENIEVILALIKGPELSVFG